MFNLGAIKNVEHRLDKPSDPYRRCSNHQSLLDLNGFSLGSVFTFLQHVLMRYTGKQSLMRTQ